MTTFPDTRDSLLALIANRDDRDAWEQFAALYQPVIYRLGRQRGMQDADAQDLSQQVLVSVASAIGRWEKQNESVRFRHWLKRVTRNAIINALSRKPRDQATGGTTVGRILAEHPAENAVGYLATNDAQITEQEIEIEYRRELYLRSADKVKQEVDLATWQAFEMTVVHGITIEEAAKELGKSTGNTYTSRSRVMRRLRETVKTIERSEQ